jgi:hypothetical protein
VTGTAAGFASPGLTAPVSDNTTTTFRATATDAAGNTSPCSSSSVGYVEDSAPPVAPTGLSSTPTSPANDNSPKVSGTAEAGSTVNLYTASDCSGSPAATGPAASFGSPGLTVTVADNSITTFKATATDGAGNVSPCSSSSVAYQEDSTLPVAPTLTGTSPSSPANDNSPNILGTAETGTTVKIYADGSCTGAVVGSGSAAAFASSGIAVSVADNSTTAFHATATDVSTNTSACSPSSVSFVEDSTPPVPSIDSGPSGVTNDHAPTFTFSSEPGAVFRCSIDTGTPGFGSCSGPGNSHTPAAPLPDGNYTFRVEATDQAGNTGTATRAFTVLTPAPPDSIPPETVINGGPKKTKKRKPKFQFASSEPGSTFQCQFDQSPFQPCASPYKAPTKLKPGRHQFSVKAIDPAGNVDATPAVRKFKIVKSS